MTHIEALQMALKKEEDAIEQYGDMAMKFPEIRQLCTDLQNEEHKHRKMIEKKIVELMKY